MFRLNVSGAAVYIYPNHHERWFVFTSCFHLLLQYNINMYMRNCTGDDVTLRCYGWGRSGEWGWGGGLLWPYTGTLGWGRIHPPPSPRGPLSPLGSPWMIVLWGLFVPSGEASWVGFGYSRLSPHSHPVPVCPQRARRGGENEWLFGVVLHCLSWARA